MTAGNDERNQEEQQGRSDDSRGVIAGERGDEPLGRGFLRRGLLHEMENWAAVDSSQTLVVRISRVPLMFIEELNTALPFSTGKGIDSPVRLLISRVEVPLTTTPSSGIFRRQDPNDRSDGNGFTGNDGFVLSVDDPSVLGFQIKSRKNRVSTFSTAAS